MTIILSTAVAERNIATLRNMQATGDIPPEITAPIHSFKFERVEINAKFFPEDRDAPLPDLAEVLPQARQFENVFIVSNQTNGYGIILPDGTNLAVREFMSVTAVHGSCVLYTDAENKQHFYDA